MKSRMNVVPAAKRWFLALHSAFGLTLSGLGAEIALKTTWTGPLNVDEAWVGETQPGETDVAVFDGVGGTNALGGSVSWKGIRLGSLSSELSIGSDEDPDDAKLTIGSEGIQKAAGTFSLRTPTELAADQTWHNGSGGFRVFAPVGGSGRLTTSSHNFAYNARVEPQGGVYVQGTSFVNKGGCFGSGVKLKSWITLNVYLYDSAVQNLMPFSDLFGSGLLINNGRFYNSLSNTGQNGTDLALSDGDRVMMDEDAEAGTLSWDSASGNFGIVNGLVRMNGGSISNHTISVVGGAIEILRGTACADTHVITGPGSSRRRDLQDVVVGGGSLRAKSVRLGDDTGLDVPARLIVTNGTVEVDDTVEMGLKSGESGTVACFVQSGGSTTVRGFRFGSALDAQFPDPILKSFGLVDVYGGILRVGACGLAVDDGWSQEGAEEDDPATSVAEARVEDATYCVVESHTNALRLALGGTVTVDTPDGVVFRPVQPLAGNGSLHKTGPGTLEFGKVNSYAGDTWVDEGMVTFGFRSQGPVCTTTFAPVAGSITTSDSEVTAVTSSDGKFSFTKSVAGAIWKGTTAPQLGTGVIGGRDALVFSGPQCGLGMTGTSATPFDSAKDIGLAIVLRATSGSGASDETDWRKTGGVMAANFHDKNPSWGVTLTEDGRIGFGIAANQTESAAVYGARSSESIIDGKAHVVVCNFTGSNGEIAIAVDGVRTAVQVGGAITKFAMCRTSLGFLEGKSGKFAAGCEIAEIRFFSNCGLTVEEEVGIWHELALKYGLDLNMPRSEPSGGDSFADEPVVDEPTGLFVADDLAGEAGIEVSSWHDRNTTGADYHFNQAVAKKVYGSANQSNPKISPLLYNGHKAVRFDGIMNCLCMTSAAGESSRYFGSTGSGTIVFVLRPLARGGSADRSGWPSEAGVFGMGNASNPGDRKLAVTFTGDGAFAAGTSDGDDSVKTIWSPVRFRQFDRHPQVVVVTVSGGSLIVNVNGVMRTLDGASESGRTLTRLSLGRVESCGGVSGGAFNGDICEIRFYRETVFAAAQQRAIIGALSAKYGADDSRAYEENVSSYYRSPNTTLAAGTSAVLGDSGLRLHSGQSFAGAGQVSGGTLTIGSGAALNATAGVLKVEDLAFEAGGTIRAKAGADGTVQFVPTAKDVALPDGTVWIDLPDVSETALKNLNGPVLSWTGALTGGDQTRFAIKQAPSRELRIDLERKVVDIEPKQGFVLIFR